VGTRHISRRYQHLRPSASGYRRYGFDKTLNPARANSGHTSNQCAYLHSIGFMANCSPVTDWLCRAARDHVSDDCHELPRPYLAEILGICLRDASPDKYRPRLPMCFSLLFPPLHALQVASNTVSHAAHAWFGLSRLSLSAPPVIRLMMGWKPLDLRDM
jgi:hypothetical protein